MKPRYSLGELLAAVLISFCVGLVMAAFIMCP